LVEQLTGFGLPSEEIHLQSVFAESTGGALLRSSSAVYRLRLRCNKLEQIPDLLSIIASQKNATFERVDWKYPDDAAHEKGLEQALAKASARASRVAAGLGVTLLGIYRFSEDVSDEEAPYPMATLAASQPRMRAVGMVPQADLGMDIQHSKNLRFSVEIEYRVAGFDGTQ
jgi:uncharacterized protein YggE